jgi:hypothetical protein
VNHAVLPGAICGGHAIVGSRGWLAEHARRAPMWPGPQARRLNPFILPCLPAYSVPDING